MDVKTSQKRRHGATQAIWNPWRDRVLTKEVEASCRRWRPSQSAPFWTRGMALSSKNITSHLLLIFSTSKYQQKKLSCSGFFCLDLNSFPLLSPSFTQAAMCYRSAVCKARCWTSINIRGSQKLCSWCYFLWPWFIAIMKWHEGWDDKVTCQYENVQNVPYPFMDGQHQYEQDLLREFCHIDLAIRSLGLRWERILNFNHSLNNIFEINNVGPEPLAFQLHLGSLWMPWRWSFTCSFLPYLYGFKRSMSSLFQGKYLMVLLGF